MTLDELILTFQRAAAGVQIQLMRVGKQIAEDLVTHAKSKIGDDTQVGRDNGIFPTWPPLEESTIIEKTIAGYPVPAPLLAQGTMRDSIGANAEPEGAASVVVNLYAEDEKMIYHELGTIDGHVPPRPVIGPTVFERAPIYSELTGVQVELDMTKYAWSFG